MKGISKFNKYLLGLFIINLIQAIFTPVLGDEAHYWIWSQEMAWGYFDHPPMVALLVRVSSFLFSGELGIRFMHVLLSTLTVPLIWNLIPDQSKQAPSSEIVFYSILLSIPVFHLYGFIATPDTPLFFAFVLYLIAFKRYDQRNDLISALFLGISAALLIYSKYHGGVFILLSILIRWELIKRPMTYFAGFIAFLLISPHLYWQYQHNFITFDYHLFERTDGSFDIKNVLGYIPAMIGVLNPALIVLLIYSAINDRVKFKNENWFQTRLFLGIIGFFFIYSFRSKVDAHWVAAAFIPLTIILYDTLIRHKDLRKAMKYISGISILVLALMRVGVIIPLPLETEFHKEGRAFFEAIYEEAKGRKVVFVNSYQRASKFSFYTGVPSYSFNNSWYRKTQYDLAGYDTLFHRQEVLLIGDYPSPFFDSIHLENGEAYLSAVVENFKVFSKMSATSPNFPNILHHNRQVHLELRLDNRHPYEIDFSDPDMPYELSLQLSVDEFKHHIPLSVDISTLQAGQSLSVEAVSDTIDILPGNYTAAITMKSGYLYHQLISKKWPIEVLAQ